VNAVPGQPGAGLRPGATLAGYRLEERIGRGGMAVVFRAVDERLGRRVALKILSPGYTADSAFRTRFINESRAAATVEHPHIIPVYGAGEASGYLYIAMRFVPGGDARSELRRTGPFNSIRAWRIISQVAAALDTAHRHGLVHRDVKPANMLLDAGAQIPARASEYGGPGPADHVYLTDFGISKQGPSHGLTLTGQILGTLEYAAPEQIDGNQVDGRADLYSLACSAFELLTGTPPFRRSQGAALIYAQLSEPPPPVTASRRDLSGLVDNVIVKAMAKEAAGRYADCTRFAADLGRALRLTPGLVEAPAVPSARRGHPSGGERRQGLAERQMHRPTEVVRPGTSPRESPPSGTSPQESPPQESPAPPGNRPAARPGSRSPAMPPGGLARPLGDEPPTRRRDR